jgi:sulfur carrier protein
VNGEERQLEDRATVWALVQSLGGPSDACGVAVAVNGEVVPRGAWERTPLAEGARVEVLAAVQGG